MSFITLAQGSRGIIHSPRNSTIDILRGIAIFTMVAANLSASLLQPDDKVLSFRLYGTFAAPLFVMLAGMMVVITGVKHTTFWHYLNRGFLIVTCGCLLDVLVWRIYPFLGYDVLYLTGLCIPVVHLLAKYCTISIKNYHLEFSDSPDTRFTKTV